MRTYHDHIRVLNEVCSKNIRCFYRFDGLIPITQLHNIQQGNISWRIELGVITLNKVVLLDPPTSPYLFVLLDKDAQFYQVQ